MKRALTTTFFVLSTARVFAQIPDSEKNSTSAVMQPRQFEISGGVGLLFNPKAKKNESGSKVPTPTLQYIAELTGNVGVSFYPIQRLGLGLQCQYFSYTTRWIVGSQTASRFIATSLSVDYNQPLERDILYFGTRIGTALGIGIDEKNTVGIRDKNSIVGNVHIGYKLIAIRDVMWAYVEIGRSINPIDEPPLIGFPQLGRSKYSISTWPLILGICYRM